MGANMTLAEFTSKLQTLCHEGLSELTVTVDGKEHIEIEYKANQGIVNIKKEREA